MSKAEGRFVWYELAASDVEAATAFYASVVGWSTGAVSMPGSDYALFLAEGTPVAGVTRFLDGAENSAITPQWTGYIGADDVDAAAARVPELGGTVHVPPTDIPNISRFSVIADPQMATLALIKGHGAGADAKTPATAGEPGGLGHVVWREWIGSNHALVFPFYSALFGWTKGAVQSGPYGTFQEFEIGSEPYGGMFDHPDKPGFSVWLFYFSVPNLQTAVRRVLSGGGKVLFGPIAVSGNARIVQCADPQGAVFGLLDRRIAFSVGCYQGGSPAKEP